MRAVILIQLSIDRGCNRTRLTDVDSHMQTRKSAQLEKGIGLSPSQHYTPSYLFLNYPDHRTLYLLTSKITVVGAGIGGLSQAGHNVVVLESADTLAEVGAGVQLTPVAIRCFCKWGLSEDLLTEAAIPDSFCVMSLDDYGAPYIVVHRADLHRTLHKHALKAGAAVLVNSRVVQYDLEQGSLVLASGEKCHADLIIAADGINSFARTKFLPDEDWFEQTGWAAYRISASVEDLQ